MFEKKSKPWPAFVARDLNWPKNMFKAITKRRFTQSYHLYNWSNDIIILLETCLLAIQKRFITGRFYHSSPYDIFISKKMGIYSQSAQSNHQQLQPWVNNRCPVGVSPPYTVLSYKILNNGSKYSSSIRSWCCSVVWW